MYSLNQPYTANWVTHVRSFEPKRSQCIGWQSAMVQSMRQPTLADIMTEAAAGPRIQEYLAERGVRTTATLALLSKDEDGVDRTLVQPLLQGWPKADGSKIEVPAAEHPIVKAIMLHMWMVAKRSMQAAMAMSAQPITPAATPTTAGSSATATEDKVPKSLAPGRWKSLIDAYQKQQLDGLDGVFPTQELLGAEAVIARMLHENETPKLYTPVGLGEIISCRTFLPTGEPNPLAKKERTGTKLRLAEDGLETMPDTPWEPRSLLAILDGLSSVKWAFILSAIAPERSVTQFFDWLVKLCRSRPAKTDQLGQFYHSTSWRLATAMRSGSTFEEATAVIMKDFDSFSECMGREPVQKATRPAQTPQDKDKGSGKSNTKPKGTPRASSWSRSPRSSWPSSQGERSQSSRQPRQWEDRSTWNKRDWSGDWATQNP